MLFGFMSDELQITNHELQIAIIRTDLPMKARQACDTRADQTDLIRFTIGLRCSSDSPRATQTATDMAPALREEQPQDAPGATEKPRAAG